MHIVQVPNTPVGIHIPSQDAHNLLLGLSDANKRAPAKLEVFGLVVNGHLVEKGASHLHLARVDPGFHASQVFTVKSSIVSGQRHKTVDGRHVRADLEALRQRPGFIGDDDEPLEFLRGRGRHGSAPRS